MYKDKLKELSYEMVEIYRYSKNLNEALDAFKVKYAIVDERPIMKAMLYALEAKNISDKAKQLPFKED